MARCGTKLSRKIIGYSGRAPHTVSSLTLEHRPIVFQHKRYNRNDKIHWKQNTGTILSKVVMGWDISWMQCNDITFPFCYLKKKYNGEISWCQIIPTSIFPPFLIILGVDAFNFLFWFRWVIACLHTCNVFHSTGRPRYNVLREKTTKDRNRDFNLI